MKKILLLCSCALLLFATFATTKHKIYVVGDSTASIYSEDLAPRTGWAQILQSFFNVDSAEVVDKAVSGRSSRSFIEEDGSVWPSVRDAMKPGDYLIIQFGHNDEKFDSTRLVTLPGSTFEQTLSIYIKAARDKGAIPILATPIERNKWDPATNRTTLKSTHIVTNKTTGISYDYPKAIRDLAKDSGVALVDMTVLTKAYFESCGFDSTTYKLFMNLAAGEFKNYPNGNSDSTHLQMRGATAVAQLFVNEVKKQNIAPLSTWLIGATAIADNRFENKSVDQIVKSSIVRNDNKSITISANQAVVSYRIFDLKGNVVNSNVSFNGNLIPLSRINGAMLQSGKYILNCKLADGFETSSVFNVK
jgi:lysophospholipase L1-like esterase